MTKSSDRQFPHAMLREIFEQPDAITRTLDYYTANGALQMDKFHTDLLDLPAKNKLLIVASGSSRHAGLVGELLIEDFSGLSVDVEFASEFIYRSKRALGSACLVVISQSGETADTLEAIREAHVLGIPTIAITNRADSTMAKLARCSLPTQAGAEHAVPATKSFTTQLVVLNLLAFFSARVRGSMTGASLEAEMQRLYEIPWLLEQYLPQWERQLSQIVDALDGIDNFLFLGRGAHYPIAREGALKLKESAYIPAEGYPAGELKHGPNALVADTTKLVVLATQDAKSPDSALRYRKTVQLLRDLQPLNARVIALATEGDKEVPALVAHTVFIPPSPDHLTPILEVVPLQLLAYFAAVKRGINVDAPRNLNKAVLVE
jgi:glucosamine--fructose-6-phosphate aminotransferase (isomerizing)